MTKEKFIESIRLEGEVWKDVPGREGIYAVSNLARFAMVQEFHKVVKNGKTFLRKSHPRILTTNLSPSQRYVRITFNDRNNRNRRKSVYVHKIVAQAFVPNPENLPCIDHIDDNPLNNVATNLRWCTIKENNNKKHRRDLLSIRRKGKISSRRRKVVQLKNGQVVRTYNYIMETQKYGFQNSGVHQACSGKIKKYKGYQWMFLEDYEKSISSSRSPEQSS